ncbi:hypothetical protein ACFLX9_03950 [Chloroflexota bacterium]
MLAFQSARSAHQYSMAIQQAFQAHNDEHPWEPIKEAGDFFGRHVIPASRNAGQSQGGKILVSALVTELVASSGDIRFNDGREVELKGLAGTHRVYQGGVAACIADVKTLRRVLLLSTFLGTPWPYQPLWRISV